MIKIVIIEDEEIYVKSIKNIIDKIKYKTDRDIKTIEFNKYNKELENLIKNNDSKTIYIIDIELKNSKSGIEIASIIRDHDWESEIIFITNHDKMFETVHRNVYEVFDFIEKYHELEKRLTKDLKVIINKNIDKKIFSYKGRNIDLQIYMHAINYIYRDKEDRKVVIVTDNSSFSVNLGVKEILELLDGRFKKVHRSCIVNTDNVLTYDWSKLKIIMKNGEEVNYLSKKFRKGITNE
ncbi:MAG: LytTR family transcriptional regulator DNA-binding domain-containing protein [Bacilli bacterium]|nr:LytTR family transcriptional regulator DNA-binding domain-containing protein [Bacilli bacterium]